MRVGTRHSDLKDDGTEQDHPHACGDKGRCKAKQDAQRGSSPCVWGQEAVCSLYEIGERIIPMRVGTS